MGAETCVQTKRLNWTYAFVDSSQDVLLLAQESALKLILLTSALFRVIWPFQNYFSCYFAILFPNFFFQASARALFLLISVICQGSSNLISRFSELYRSSFLKFLHKNQRPSFLILLLSATFHCYFNLISRFFQLYFLGALSTPSWYSPACRLAKSFGNMAHHGRCPPRRQKATRCCSETYPGLLQQEALLRSSSSLGACSRMEQTSNQGGHPKASKPVGLAIRAHGRLNLG